MENQLPVGWQLCNVEFIADLLRGITYTKEQARNNPEQGFKPILRANNINGELNFDSLVYIPQNLINENQYIRKDDIVFAMSSGSKHLVGKSARATQDFNGSYGAFCGLVRPIEHICKSYLYYVFQEKTFKTLISQIAKGSNINNLKREHILDFKLPLAPINEQKRIVTKIEELFSELDSGIASLKTAQEKLKVYRQAVLKHAFEGKLTAQWREENKDKLETPEQLLARIQQERENRYQEQLAEWENAVEKWEADGKEGKKPSKPSAFKPMQDITDEEINKLPVLPNGWIYARLAEISTIGSGMSVSKDRKLNNPVTVPYLRVANVQRGKLDLTEIKSMQVEQDALEDLRLAKWDVLFNEGGDRDKLGRGWIWENQIDPCITQNHVFKASPLIKSEYHSKFISHWGNSFGKDYFEKGGKQTTNLASINKTVLSNFPVPLLPFNEQEKIIEMLDDTMSQIDVMETELENGIHRAEILRQSILKKAFSGQLVPQDPNDEPASELLARIQAEKAAVQEQPQPTPVNRGRKAKEATHG